MNLSELVLEVICRSIGIRPLAKAWKGTQVPRSDARGQLLVSGRPGVDPESRGQLL